MSYSIIRHYCNAGIKKRIIAVGLTLEEGQAHCKDPNSSYKTAISKTAKARTRKLGAWFDGYTDR